MRKVCSLLVLLVVLASALAFSSQAVTTSVAGDYVEVRTASVFAGACHYNGELMTTGREAVLAWQIKTGQWQHVDLAGVRALAVVSADANLAEAQAARRAELVVDSAATEAQATAVVAALKSKYGALFGHVIVVRRAPVSFRHAGDAYVISAPNIAELNVRALPDNACCRMPQLVWYNPLVPLAGRKVGLTLNAAYAGGAAGERWQQARQNSAFYGSFAF